MISQENYNGLISIKYITQKFREFTQLNDEWINEKWIGRALKRMILIKDKKRTNNGIEVILDIEKAQETRMLILNNDNGNWSQTFISQVQLLANPVVLGILIGIWLIFQGAMMLSARETMSVPEF
jgi:hypothetical protein